MLSVLRLKNLAIISEIELEFGRGLNVLTGETGAGKSMILKGIELLAGKRATTDLIRHGADRLEIEGQFILDPATARLLADQELLEAKAALEGEIVVRRSVDNSGRSKIHINGRLSGAAELQQLAPYLMSITGQHQQQALLDPNHHREMLDAFGVKPELLEQVNAAYQEYAEARRLLETFRKESDSRSEYFRRLTFERDELAQANLGAGEREELEAQEIRLSSFEVLAQAVTEALELLEEEGGGIEDRLRRLRAVVSGALTLDRGLTEPFELIDSAAIQLKEADAALTAYGQSLQGDPERLEEVRGRIAEIARLERKYGKSAAELVEYLRQISDEVSDFESGAFDLEKLEKRLADARTALTKIEERLRAERLKAAEVLPKIVERELALVNMKRASFQVAVTPSASGPFGADTVEFLLSANPGEPAKPLAKVASGGELSRILLILKTVLRERSSTSLLQVFDEVDAGIGGAVAQVVGERLKALAKDSQVLLITHAPQIASLANEHFLIIKTSSADSTTTEVRKLTSDERISEVARMLAGKKVTASFEGSAKELLGHPHNRAARG